MAAAHHSAPYIIHNQRRHLGGCVNRAGMGERPFQGVAFHAKSAAHSSPGGPGVKPRSTVPQGDQPIPDVSLPIGFVGFRGDGLD